MRGKRTHIPKAVIRTGITPAGAGKTTPVIPCVLDGKDHPRRCGENQHLMTDGTNTAGSPPQVRGKPVLYPPSINSFRITPAGAGKTSKKCECIHLPWDHPRRCGENFSLVNAADKSSGSPPQVRGKLFSETLCYTHTRITPAGAGKTLQIRICQRIF